jgi:hypothetical protein
MSSAGAPSSAAPAFPSTAATAAAAGPTSAAPASTAAAATGGGASAGTVFVKRSGDPRARFAPVDIFVGDAVGHLADRASLKLEWRITAAYVDLFLVKPAGDDDEPSPADEAAALARPRLRVGVPLSRAHISSGAWVVALVGSPPAAALGECAGLRPPFVLTKVWGWSGMRDVRDVPLGVFCMALTFFPCAFPSQPVAAAAASAAVIAVKAATATPATRASVRSL